MPPVLIVATRGGRRGIPFQAALAAVVLLAGTVAGFVSHLELHRIQVSWDEIWSQREARAAELLTEDLDRLLRSADEAVLELAEDPPRAGGAADVDRLRSLRERTGMAAVAVYGPEERLQVWDGIHRGPLPDAVRQGTVPYAYGERPLFSYLYVTERIPSTGGTAVAAALLRASLPPGLESTGGDFASRVRSRTGENIRISRADRMAGDAVWDLRWDDRTLFSVSVVEPRQGDEREAALTRWGRILALLIGTGWLLLATGGRDRPWRLEAAGVSLVVLAALLPLGRLLGLPDLDSPTSFLLGPPVEATLLRTLAIVSAATVALGMLVGSGMNRKRTVAGLVVIGGGFPMILAAFGAAPSTDFLGGSERAFVVIQATTALLLALIAAVGLFLAADPGRREVRRGRLTAATVSCVALGIGGAAWVALRGDIPVFLALLWVVPAGLVLRSPGRRRGWLRRAPLVLMAGVLGATCALPFVWGDRVDARMEVGEMELARLGAPADPYTEFLLERFATRVDSLEGTDPGAVELLYRGWVESGLAREGVPAWLTLWSTGNLPTEDLRIGLPPPRPTAADEFLDDARGGSGPLIRRLERPDARYVAVVPLSSGEVVTAVVPPRTAIAGYSSLEPLFAGTEGTQRDALTLVPLLPEDVRTPPDTTRWMRTDGGWQGERTFQRPDGSYHAHYSVELAGPGLLVARGTLLLVLDLALMGTLFGAGLLLSSARSLPLERAGRVIRTFQGRVTLALFGFFLLSVMLFGAVSYRIVSGAAIRTATALAERVADEASGWYLEVQGSMDLLARRVGSDLLEYREGELVGGSVTELVELGLYEGWLPYDVHRRLSGREGLVGQETSSVGEWEYVVAYRRLPSGDVLGAPVPLQAGAAALRRREIADFLAFGVLLGGALSLGLAFLIARTLARPIRDLRAAAGRVGRGDLRLRLPAGRSDEFGAVFRDFNRMVARLRRARGDLVRTTRRTRAIVEEAATGVVALDAQAEVTLVNPRAEELLHTEIVPGEPLPAGEGPAGELASWVKLYFRDALRAADTELHDGERRIRVQARRISSPGRPGGAVLSLEDVTDELRTERILAWGEMAQQVAHEVKNPLTPIKLSVQHIRRAWEDQRSDFGEILRKNVDAMLREIDRLATIARSFSRFAAPRAAGEGPLEPVRLEEVVAEILDLYATDEGPVRFQAELPPDLPPVTARTGELKEVLVNLLENARSAIEERGTVAVEAERIEETVELRVRDDGQGIPRDLLPRIFEPHFSTRSSGTGLGLAIVRRLVESWGGAVSADSREGEGTVVRITLFPWKPAKPDGP